jgi:hypothetical protein
MNWLRDFVVAALIGGCVFVISYFIVAAVR